MEGEEPTEPQRPGAPPKRRLWKRVGERIVHHIEHSHEQFASGLSVCLVMALVLLSIKVSALEGQTVYKKLRLGVYEAMQRFLADLSQSRGSVVVIDISGLHRERDDVSPTSGPVHGEPVSRRELEAEIRYVASLRPAGIGVDIDFSPTIEHNAVTFSDYGFVTDCEDITQVTGTPIVLGVFTQAVNPPEYWLPREQKPPSIVARNLRMCGGLGIGTESFAGKVGEFEGLPNLPVNVMFTETRYLPGIRPQPLRSLAAKMADLELSVSQSAVPKIMRWIVEDRAEVRPIPHLLTEGFLVDYSSLNRLPIVELSGDLPKDDPRFRDKLVLFGNVLQIPDDGTKIEAGSDLFRIPGHNGKFSGALLHACAIETLLGAPIRQWTPVGRAAADLLLAVLSFGLCFFLTKRVEHRFEIEKKPSKLVSWAAEHHLAVEMLTALFVGLVVCVVALPLAGVFRLAWDDACFVALILLIHPLIHRLLRKWLASTPGAQAAGVR